MTLSALRVRGPFLGTTGYDHHVREFVRELARQGVAVQLDDLPQWRHTRLMKQDSELPARLRDPWFEGLSDPVDARTFLHFCMPEQVAPDAALTNVNYTMTETTRIPRRWRRLSERVSRVIVPSDFSRRAWLSSGVAEDRVRVCPLGVNTDAYHPGLHPLPLADPRGRPIDRFRTRFLNVSTASPRKNLPGLLRAWIAATRPDDNAVLIVKAGMLFHNWSRQFRQQLAHLEYRGRTLRQAAPIILLTETFSDAEMPRLFASATHYISLSFAEGWDLPMVEAAAADLQLIAPDHSAYRDYLDSATARLIPCRAIPADYELPGILGPLVRFALRGAQWWQPDDEAAAGYIREAIEGYDTRCASPRRTIASRYTWANATKHLIALLDEVADSRG